MEEKKLVPNRRFRGFESNWNKEMLGYNSEILTGGTPSTEKTKYWNPKQIPWLSSGEINKKRINSTEDKISVLGLENSSARWVEENSILIALAGQGKTRGKVAVNNIRLTTNQSIAAIIPKQNLYYEFIFQNLIKRYEELRSMSSGGGARGGLNKELIFNISLSYPTKEEQQKIGEFFKVLDERIANQERKIAKVKALKSAYLTEMFPQEGEIIPKRRFEGFEGEWEQKKLGELSVINTGDSDVKDSVYNGKYPFFVRSKTIEKSDLYTFDGEAILIPGEGKLGEIYHYFNGKFNYHQRVYKISNFVDDINGRFIYYFMHRTFKRHAMKHTVKATVDSLRLPVLTSYKIMLPNKSEQQKISEFFKNLDDQIVTEEKKLEKLKKMKEAYLEEMFV